MPTIESPIRSIALGSFDGMHVAHRELIALAEGVGVIERFSSRRLTPGYKRSWYCDKPMSFYLFDRVRDLSAAEFVAKLREDFPRLEKIVVGYDFRFGKERQGTVEALEELFDGEVTVVSEVTVGGVSVHARTIREYLRQGELAMANRLLGRPYLIDGEPVRGQGIGSRELVPTINLQIEGYQLPAEGVYAGRSRVGGVWYPSATFVGHRESVDGGFAVETHILDRQLGEVSGRVMVEFHLFLRVNRRFRSLEALKRQIEEDLAMAREKMAIL
ncbi:bifunctional riboflavin kinase/FAD synthetase [Nitratifractor sp.]